MGWQKKAAAPAYVNVLDEVRAIVTGGTDAWLIPWIGLLPGQHTLDVTTFCTLGPPPDVPLSPADFLTKGWAAAGILAAKLGAWGEQKLFAAYCEYVAPAVGCVTSFEQITVQTHSRNFEEYDTFVDLAIATGATSLRITEYLLPNNGQNAAWPANWRSLRMTFHNMPWTTTYADLHPVNLPQFATYVTVTVPTGATHCSIGVNDNPPGNYGFKIESCGMPPVVSPYTPPATVHPTAAIAPAAKTYTTIAHLGAELDELEKKLHWVLDYTSGQIWSSLSPLVADDVFTVDSDDDAIPLAADVAGFIVTVSNIGPGVGMHFGSPPALQGLGRVVVGNGTAWEPPIDIQVSPMLILKKSVFETQCRVQVNPPATATVTTLAKQIVGPISA